MASTTGILAIFCAIFATQYATISGQECGVPDRSHPPALRISGGKIIGLRQGISGGDEVEPHSYPWTVHLGNCGASLINKQWVLTAAHCVANDYGQATATPYVKLGAHDTSLTRGVKAAKVIVHEKYRGACKGKGYDIALIKLPQPVKFTDKIKPICLPSRSDSFQTEGEKFVASGWGQMKSLNYPNKLRHVVMHTSQDECKRNRWSWVNLDNEFCGYGGRSSGQSTCMGDSGGPQFLYKNGKYVQIGVTSCGPRPCGSTTIPNLYTHIPDFIDWINKYIKDVDAGEGVDVNPTCFDKVSWCPGFEASCKTDNNVKTNCRKMCGLC